MLLLISIHVSRMRVCMRVTYKKISTCTVSVAWVCVSACVASEEVCIFVCVNVFFLVLSSFGVYLSSFQCL